VRTRLGHSHHTIQVVDPADWRRRRNAEASNRIPRIVFQWKFSRVGMTVERRYFAPGACTFNKSQGARAVDVRNPPFAPAAVCRVEPSVALC
jgi:hypothetical protein